MLQAERAAFEKTRGLTCRDGTMSPTCRCHGPRRGCCSHHRGVAGCGPLPAEVSCLSPTCAPPPTSRLRPLAIFCALAQLDVGAPRRHLDATLGVRQCPGRFIRGPTGRRSDERGQGQADPVVCMGHLQATRSVARGIALRGACQRASHRRAATRLPHRSIAARWRDDKEEVSAIDHARSVPTSRGAGPPGAVVAPLHAAFVMEHRRPGYWYVERRRGGVRSHLGGGAPCEVTTFVCMTSGLRHGDEIHSSLAHTQACAVQQ